MSEDRTVEILKNAILLEKRGKAFYHKVAEQASGKAVKAFFEMMADEEVKHVKILIIAKNKANKWRPKLLRQNLRMKSQRQITRQQPYQRPCPWKKMR
jgi:rubrerythrin